LKKSLRLNLLLRKSQQKKSRLLLKSQLLPKLNPIMMEKAKVSLQNII
jgi:hypothetical protein